MREVINNLNKKTLSDATNISYSKLRKYASGAVKELSSEEINKIHDYLISIAEKFKVE